MDKADQIRTRLALLPKLSERVFRDVAEIERRCSEAARTTGEHSVMAFLDKIAERLKQIGNKSRPQEAKEAVEAFRQAIADPEAFSENLDDPTIDILLDRSLTAIERAQADLETQLFELQAIGAELDQLLHKPPKLS
jgi:hypothetical protein